MAWQKVKLGKIAEVTSSKRIFANQYVDKGIPFYRQKEIIERNNKQDVSEPLFISQDLYEEIKKKYGVPCEGDLLITGVGTLGIPYVVGKEVFYFKDGNLIWLKKFSQEVNSKFVYYYISSEAGQKAMWSRTIGAAQPALTIDLVKQYEIPLPPLATQQKIADILSAYDNLIENNQKQIKLLEEAAQRLYKQWFIDLRYPGHETTPIVDGLPEGWSVKTVDDIAEYINGYAFKPSDWQTKGYPIIKIKEMNEGVTADTPRNSGETILPKYVIGSGDIVFSWSATLAAIIWDGETGLLNQHLFKVIPHKDFSREFVLQTIKNTLEEFQNLTTGSTMKHIQRGKLKEVKVNTPTSNIMKEFEKITEPIRNQILNKKKQILDLIQSRDRSLPKLMNNELEV